MYYMYHVYIYITICVMCIACIIFILFIYIYIVFVCIYIYTQIHTYYIYISLCAIIYILFCDHTSQIVLNPSILASVELDALDSSGCLGLTVSHPQSVEPHRRAGTLFRTIPFYRKRDKGSATECLARETSTYYTRLYMIICIYMKNSIYIYIYT